MHQPYNIYKCINKIYKAYKFNIHPYDKIYNFNILYLQHTTKVASIHAYSQNLQNENIIMLVTEKNKSKMKFIFETS